MGLGLFADAIFGLVAIVNTVIGIRSELRAKETLDRLALLVAPRAKVIRDGKLTELHAEEVVPGDVVRVEPGDQLVADGEVIAARGLTMDESILTGEADGVRKRRGDRALSGSFCLAGSGHYEVDAVREKSYAGRVAGEARAFRHPLSPLQEEVNRVLWATTIVMVPLGIVLRARAVDPKRRAHGRRPDGDRRPRDDGARGAGAADDGDARGRRGAPGADADARAADERHRGARRRRHDLRRQDRDADRRHPRARRGGGRRPRAARAGPGGAGALRSLGRRAQPHPSDDRRAFPRRRRGPSWPRCRSPRPGSGAARRSTAMAPPAPTCSELRTC